MPMALWKPDLIVELTLLPSASGGRAGPTPSAWFGCPVSISGEYLDARFDLTTVGGVALGQAIQVPLKFIFPEFAMPQITVGQVLTLYAGRIIGHARVISVHAGA